MSPVAGAPPARTVFAVLASMALVVLDAGVVNVALPAIGGSLGAEPAEAVLVVTAYQTGLVMALLPCGALGERFGHRRVFAWGLAAFIIASGLCAAAPGLPWLVAARFVQGLGGAAVMALGVALLRFAVPEGRLGAAIGWNALTVALAAAAAPSLGAVILSAAGWPWLFAVNLPLGGLALLAARGAPSGPAGGRALDLVSLALNAAAFGLLVVGVELAPAAPVAAVVLLAAAAAALWGLVRREGPKAAPLMPLDLLRAAPFRTSVIASVCCFAGQTVGLLALPFYLQQGLGQGALATGLYMTAWPLSVAATATVAGRLADRWPAAWLCAAGGACLAGGLLAAAAWPIHGDPWPLVPVCVLCGLGFGLFQTPNNRSLFLSAPAARSGAAGGMQGTARLSGQTAGALAMMLLFSLAAPDAAPRIGFALGAASALAAALVSLSGAFPSPPAGAPGRSRPGRSPRRASASRPWPGS
ncbi:MFS transporter [Phenylobacterium sp.]|uniref:MFS transporter n=1 Tax=Phenylobacterium sp. TaxID=1871053 RepID=UPI002FE1432E